MEVEMEMDNESPRNTKYSSSAQGFPYMQEYLYTFDHLLETLNQAQLSLTWCVNYTLYTYILKKNNLTFYITKYHSLYMFNPLFKYIIIQ